MTIKRYMNIYKSPDGEYMGGRLFEKVEDLPRAFKSSFKNCDYLGVASVEITLKPMEEDRNEKR